MKTVSSVTEVRFYFNFLMFEFDSNRCVHCSLPEIRLESFFKWPCIVTLVVTRSRRSVSRAWTKLGEGKHGERCWIGRLRCRRARPKRRAMLHNSGSE